MEEKLEQLKNQKKASKAGVDQVKRRNIAGDVARDKILQAMEGISNGS